MSVIQPSESGQLTIAGFRIFYEVFGDPSLPPVLLLPAWQIVYRRVWKMQVPFLARQFHVITFDSPGNGLAERTTDPRAFEYDRIVDQAIGILDHLGIERASVLGFSRGCHYGIAMAARYLERVARLILIANGVTSTWEPTPTRREFSERRDSYEGWEKRNAHYWQEHYCDWLAFFFGEMFSELHSTKGIDDSISWALETMPEVLVRTTNDAALFSRIPASQAVARIRCPVLIIHGEDDRINSIEASRELTDMRPDWEFVTLEGCGHAPLLRDPVRVNLLLREFLERDRVATMNGESRHAGA